MPMGFHKVNPVSCHPLPARTHTFVDTTWPRRAMYRLPAASDFADGVLALRHLAVPHLHVSSGDGLDLRCVIREEAAQVYQEL